MKSYYNSVSGKLILAAGVAITLIMMTYTGFSAWRTQTRVYEQTMAVAEQQSSWAASQVGLQMTEAIAASAALSGVLEGYMETETPTKSGVIQMLEHVTLKYKNIYSAWMSGLENNVLNGLLAGQEGNNAAGVFTPYWTRNETDDVDFTSFDIALDQEWYAVPLKTGQSLATEPYMTSEGIMMTSISIPVRHKGEIVALAGVDITLANMVALMAEIETFEGGQMMLVDNAGKWAANPDAAQLAKPYSDLGEDQVRLALADGEPRVITGFGDERTRIVYPFTVDGMSRTWATILDVPDEVFDAPVYAEFVTSVIAGLTILLLVIGALYLATMRVVKRPLLQMLGAINALAARNYNISLPDTQRRDEMGAMAKSVSTLRENLIEKDEMEAEQVLLREAAEAARESQNAEEARARQEREARRAADHARELKEQEDREALRREQEAENDRRAAELSDVIESLAKGLRGVAKGDLDVAIATGFPPAYEPLRVDFNNTVHHLVELVSSISIATKEIASGTQEISRSTTDLSRQAEQNAATLEETAAALNELTVSVKSAATISRSTDEIVRETSRKADSTTSVVRETVTAMEEIKSSSERIAKIIDVIDTIAFQTNLLALNAGVEAARAGEAGRGFAVVASEVRDLSQRSSAAAREIDELISHSSSQVLNGVALVGRTGEALDGILQSIGVIARHVGDIAASADEQAMGISEINTAVSQLDRVQQQNAASFEETTASCMTLDQQAEGLSDLVAQFQIKESAWEEEDDQDAA